ncbi:MAG: permease, partial [Paracoccaceae bacterium]|nr:permease [Paracoccaceae bacterium]
MTAHSDQPHESAPFRTWAWYAGVPLAALIWWWLYQQLVPFSEWATALLPVERDSHAGDAIAFFLYDVPKVLLLLTGIVFVTGFLRSWFSPEKTRAILSGKRQIWGYPLAAALGVMTPFCSCSSVPLFIGFVSAGIPLGVTFSFLIAGPMVGPVGLGLLYALVGWKIATI